MLGLYDGIESGTEIDYASPVILDHPLNVGKVFWGLCLPGFMGGAKLRDLMSPPNLVVGNNPSWTGIGDPNIPSGANGWRGASQFSGLGSLFLDGSAGYLTTPDSTALKLGGVGQSVAISFWLLSLTANQASKTFLGKTNNGSAREYEFKTDSAGAMTWQMYDGTNNPYRLVNASRFNTGWHHFLGVRNPAAGVMTLYLDGVALSDAGQNTGINANFATTNAFTIGNAAAAASGYAKCYINDVNVWSRAPSAAEAVSIYHLSKRGYPGMIRRVGTTVYFVGTSGIQFDAASNSGYQAAASTYNWSHTCTGSNRFLSVDVALLSAGQTVSSITYNGVALSLIGAKSTVSSVGRVECWGLANPASGSNTIAVTLSGSIASSAEAVSYTGVHQTSPTEAFNSAQATNVGAADATVTITPVADQTWIHGAIATDDTAVTANQTSRNNVTGVGGSGADEDTGPISPAAGTAVSYTGVGALATWAIAGYAIRPVGASALTGSLYRTTNLDGLSAGGSFFANPLG